MYVFALMLQVSIDMQLLQLIDFEAGFCGINVEFTLGEVNRYGEGNTNSDWDHLRMVHKTCK